MPNSAIRGACLFNALKFLQRGDNWFEVNVAALIANTSHNKRYVIGVDPSCSTLGPWLECDAEHECFTGPRQEEVNRIVRGFYREPYVVPEIKA